MHRVAALCLLLAVWGVMTSQARGIPGTEGEEDTRAEGQAADQRQRERIRERERERVRASEQEEAEIVRETLVKEFDAMQQQQERNSAYLDLLLDRLRSLPIDPATPLVDFRPQAPPPDLLPVAAPLQQFYRPNPDEKKSSNYISYCHFKICNMGKRKWN